MTTGSMSFVEEMKREFQEFSDLTRQVLVELQEEVDYWRTMVAMLEAENAFLRAQLNRERELGTRH